MMWNCEILEAQGHMSTFIPTFSDGYLLLSSKLSMTFEMLLEIVDDSTLNVVDELLYFHSDRNTFAKTSDTVDLGQLYNWAFDLGRYEKFDACREICAFILKEEQKNYGEKYKEKVEKLLYRTDFYELVDEAKQLRTEEKYKDAAALYIKAFAMEDMIRGTHGIRMESVPVLAQADKPEEAFEQLELLANIYKLGGNDYFLENPDCEPLHKDKR